MSQINLFSNENGKTGHWLVPFQWVGIILLAALFKSLFDRF
jgi:hypothetical protein